MRARLSVFLDANVLVPVALTDLLLRMAEAGLYRPLWAERVIAEMVEALSRVHPALSRRRWRIRVSLMNGAFPDACVYQDEDVPCRGLPDPGDEHVLDAAVRGGADLIVTRNVQDFPVRVTARSGIRAQTPDDFLLDCLELDSARVVHVVLSQVEDARRPPLTVDTLLGSIARAGAPHFASVVPVHGAG